jgi:hypothetical protein
LKVVAGAKKSPDLASPGDLFLQPEKNSLYLLKKVSENIEASFFTE